MAGRGGMLGSEPLADKIADERQIQAKGQPGIMCRKIAGPFRYLLLDSEKCEMWEKKNLQKVIKKGLQKKIVQNARLRMSFLANKIASKKTFLR